GDRHRLPYMEGLALLLSLPQTAALYRSYRGLRVTGRAPPANSQARLSPSHPHRTVAFGKPSVPCLADARERKMKRRARFGELLSRMVPLSGHDVEEILQEQSATRRRFGEIALAWGLCKPEHVWDAWCQQSTDGTETIDLDKVGVDTQAAAMLPAPVARQHHVIPLRVANESILL